MQNNRHRIATLLSIVFVSIAVVFLVMKIARPVAKLDENTAYVNELAAAELDSIDEFFEPRTPEEARQIASQLVGRAFSTPSLLESVGGRELPNETQLRQLITDRIYLIFNPDYEVFVSQIGELLDREGDEVLRGTMFADESLWYVFANTYKNAGVAINTTRATLDLHSVTMNEGLWGGRQTTFGDPGVYDTKQLVEGGATVFNIGIPVMLPPENEPDARVMVLYATLSFVWDQSRGKWLPYRTAVYDPTGTLGALPSLWM